MIAATYTKRRINEQLWADSSTCPDGRLACPSPLSEDMTRKTLWCVLNFQTETNSSRDLQGGTSRNNRGTTLTCVWRGFVYTMKSASKFDDQESLPVPDNHILAIIKNPEEAKVIIETLNGSGFSPMILVF
jgi:hypothetical protein